ncbi:MAG: c-type cytochrome [Polaromonas sp.]|uniref:c-type cytochrome n=1 Tax=Polaromonas sp. TaxID=1869339 RepID=UPI002736E291|nr:c-type cytochrome [Polaromonas sp.]MDP2817381.1 c-type cytochrome [Polaromonas sp.]
MKIYLSSTTLALCALAASSLSHAQTAPAQALYTRSLAATCANCHGTDGRAVQGSSALPLAGMDKNYLVAQMKAFKTGTRSATVMHQISKGYSDAQIDVLAGYFAAQKK